MDLSVGLNPEWRLGSGTCFQGNAGEDNNYVKKPSAGLLGDSLPVPADMRRAS